MWPLQETKKLLTDLDPILLYTPHSFASLSVTTYAMILPVYLMTVPGLVKMMMMFVKLI